MNELLKACRSRRLRSRGIPQSTHVRWFQGEQPSQQEKKDNEALTGYFPPLKFHRQPVHAAVNWLVSGLPCYVWKCTETKKAQNPLSITYSNSRKHLHDPQPFNVFPISRRSSCRVFCDSRLSWNCPFASRLRWHHGSHWRLHRQEVQFTDGCRYHHWSNGGQDASDHQCCLLGSEWIHLE